MEKINTCKEGAASVSNNSVRLCLDKWHYKRCAVQISLFLQTNVFLQENSLDLQKPFSTEFDANESFCLPTTVPFCFFPHPRLPLGREFSRFSPPIRREMSPNERYFCFFVFCQVFL